MPLAVTGLSLLFLSGSAAGSGVGQHDVSRSEDAKATMGDLVEVRTDGPAEATTGIVSIAPGGHTPWHHHPGPHIVTVKAGTLRIYETDCSFKTYTAGQGLYDPGRTDHPHIHTAHNPETVGNVELAITDIRQDDKRLMILTDPQPAACFSSPARGIGAFGVARTEGAKAMMTDPIEITTKGPSKKLTGQVSIGPGGHTAWHHHPGPHIVMVKAGTLRVYETDCGFKTYTAGQGFFDPGRTDHPHIHTAHNPEATANAVMAITDIREADERMMIATNPEPASCFAAAAVPASAVPAAAVPASAVQATGAADLPRTGAAGRTGLLAALGLGMVGAGAAARALRGRSDQREWKRAASLPTDGLSPSPHNGAAAVDSRDALHFNRAGMASRRESGRAFPR